MSGVGPLVGARVPFPTALPLLNVKIHQGSADEERFIASFTGSHRHIMDYLVEEVLSHQPQDVQDFLVRTSILDRLTGSLCDAVTASTESTTMLEDVGLRARGLLALARLAGTLGDITRATALFDEALEQAKHSRHPHMLAIVQAQQARWWLSLGKSEQARGRREAGAFDQNSEPEYRHETGYLVLAHVLMAEAKHTEAFQLLERWLNYAHQQGRTGSVIEILMLRALPIRN